MTDFSSIYLNVWKGVIINLWQIGTESFNLTQLENYIYYVSMYNKKFVMRYLVYKFVDLNILDNKVHILAWWYTDLRTRFISLEQMGTLMVRRLVNLSTFSNLL